MELVTHFPSTKSNLQDLLYVSKMETDKKKKNELFYPHKSYSFNQTSRAYRHDVNHHQNEIFHWISKNH